MGGRGAIDWAGLARWSAATAGLPLDAGQLAQLDAYVETLLTWNRKLALVSQNDRRVIADKHVADSLVAAAHCAGAASIVDLGSGGGFPALPIAIALRQTRVTLIESRGAKASFLEEACRSASIRNATVRHARIAEVARVEAAAYEIATARALATTAEVVAAATPLVRPDGRIIAMRSIGEGREGEPSDAQEIAYSLPDGTKRRLLVVRVAARSAIS